MDGKRAARAVGGPGDHSRMRAAGVVFEEAPRHESYGTVAVFRDLHGNRWAPLEPARAAVSRSAD